MIDKRVLRYLGDRIEVLDKLVDDEETEVSRLNKEINRRKDKIGVFKNEILQFQKAIDELSPPEPEPEPDSPNEGEEGSGDDTANPQEPDNSDGNIDKGDDSGATGDGLSDSDIEEGGDDEPTTV